MRPRRRLPPAPLLVVAAALLAGAAWWVLKPHAAARPRFTGYVVSQNLYMSTPVAGTIVAVSVARGQRVEAGAPLFRVDPTTLGARADQARAQIQQAQAESAARGADLGRARTALPSAEAAVVKARQDLDRLSAAQKDKAGAVAAQQLDQARAVLTEAIAQRDSARQQVAGAQAAVAAAQAGVTGGEAGLTAARRQVDELAPRAPVAARVDDVMYRPGEWAAANVPVVSLVPDGEVKVRFFVPQAAVAAYPPGTQVAIACDGCAGGMTARVDFVAPKPEYTPPIIYSLETRDKLVFMVEAAPSAPRALLPGQPIDVTPLAGAATARASP